MSNRVHIGTCGWSYLKPKDFVAVLAKPYVSTLQAYAQLFDAVEVNSTFYRIPTLSTALKWVKEAAAMRRSFVFTVKAYQGITHRDRFGKQSRTFYNQLEQDAAALNAPVILFQCPASFQATSQNARKLISFFAGIERGPHALAWEPRGTWLDSPRAVKEVCESSDLIHCVDPFRSQSLFYGKENIAYLRLHGFGTPSMYQYCFSAQELNRLESFIHSLPDVIRQVYVFFNNVSCYENATTFSAMMSPVR